MNINHGCDIFTRVFKLSLSFTFSSFELKSEFSDFVGNIMISLTVKEGQIQITDKTRIIPSSLILNSI